jgi:GDSL-like Lipase/Acylhydrolase family
MGFTRMKFVWIIAIVTLILLGATELFLRWRYGFGNPLTYQADAEIGYLLRPNQQTRRFGNHIAINQYSMRSDPITPQRSADTIRIFLIGDSVANGGWWTDQANTISAMLQEMVQNTQPKTSRSESPGVEVLNASANSWSPRSELAYLQRFGLFESQMIVLIINTDDLFATAPSPLVVGHDRNYPTVKPGSAIAEVVQRYLLPAPPLPAELQTIQSEGGDRVGKALAAIQQIQTIAQQGQARLLVVMTPLLREVETSPRDYEQDARARLLALTQQQQIDYIDCLTFFQTEKQPKTLYHDHIHLSAAGNRRVSDRISQWVSAQSGLAQS